MKFSSTILKILDPVPVGSKFEKQILIRYGSDSKLRNKSGSGSGSGLIQILKINPDPVHH